MIRSYDMMCIDSAVVEVTYYDMVMVCDVTAVMGPFVSTISRHYHHHHHHRYHPHHQL